MRKVSPQPGVLFVQVGTFESPANSSADLIGNVVKNSSTRFLMANVRFYILAPLTLLLL